MSTTSIDTESIPLEPRIAPRRQDASVERDRFGFGALAAVFAVAAILAGSLGAGIGAKLGASDSTGSGSRSVAAGASGGEAGPTAPTTGAPGAAAGTTTTSAAKHTHNEDQEAELQPDKPLDPAAQKLIAEQLVTARAAAARYPTVRDAKAAGLVLAGGNAPGVGAHYQLMSIETLKGVNADGTINAGYPGSFIYSGVTDDAPVVGLMYMSMTSDTAPEGFAGPNDHWHRHSNLCLRYGPGQVEVPFPPDGDVTKEQCDEVQGRFMERTIWMVHAWVVPGWESPKGVFSHDNPNVHCADGTDTLDAKGFFCLKQ